MKSIETQRLYLRRFNEEDWSSLYEYLSNPETIKYEPYSVFTPEACKLEAMYRARSDSFWAVCLKSNHKLIGNLYTKEQTPESFMTWELGYIFNSAYHKKGYALESSTAMLSHLFVTLHAKRVIALCSPDNIASWILLERLGFKREACLQKNLYYRKDKTTKPIQLDTYEYSLLIEEWRSNKNESVVR